MEAETRKQRRGEDTKPEPKCGSALRAAAKQLESKNRREAENKALSKVPSQKLRKWFLCRNPP